MNSSIAIKNPDEEIALTLKGKKSNLKTSHFARLLCEGAIAIERKTIKIDASGQVDATQMGRLIALSFLADDMENYTDIQEYRLKTF